MTNSRGRTLRNPLHDDYISSFKPLRVLNSNKSLGSLSPCRKISGNLKSQNPKVNKNKVNSKSN